MRGMKSTSAALLVGIVADLCADADAFRQTLQVACSKERKLLKWFRIEVSTTRASLRVGMVPTESFNKLLAAAGACGGNRISIHRAARAERAQNVARVKAHNGVPQRGGVKKSTGEEAAV